MDGMNVGDYGGSSAPVGTSTDASDSAAGARAQAWQGAVAEAHAGAGAPTNAAGLIDQATDHTTGKIDTQALTASVAGASAHDPARASAAYDDIHTRLVQRDPPAAAQFDHDVVGAFARAGTDGVTGLSTGLSSAGKKLLVDNPILTKRWESTESAWTGKSGFTPGLRDLLKKNGIDVGRAINTSPAGSLNKASNVPAANANNTNGALARDAIAQRLADDGASVKTEVPRQGGSRVVDVVADTPAKDPRMAERLEVESKVGRTSQSPTVARQAAADGKALAESSAIRGTGRALETAGKVLRPVAVAADAIQLGQAFHEDGDRIGAHTGEAAAGIAGGWGGAIAGAEGGAAVGALAGSVVPVVGNAAGAIIGGIAGGIAGGLSGDWAGRRAFNWMKSMF